MSDNKWSDKRLHEIVSAALEKATDPVSWFNSAVSKRIEAERYSTQHIYNINVNDKFGEDVDHYLHMNYAEYNYHTEVVIIANATIKTHQYIHFIPDDIDPSLVKRIVEGRVAFQQIMTYSGTMLLAYAPEINTLFVRTLFDVIRTPDNPDDKFDIEAKLGL